MYLLTLKIKNNGRSAVGISTSKAAIVIPAGQVKSVDMTPEDADSFVDVLKKRYRSVSVTVNYPAAAVVNKKAVAPVPTVDPIAADAAGDLGDEDGEIAEAEAGSPILDPADSLPPETSAPVKKRRGRRKKQT